MNEQLIVAISADIKDLKAKLAEANKNLQSFNDGVSTGANSAKSAFSGLQTQVAQLALGFVSLQAAVNLLGNSFQTSLKLDSVNSALTAILGTEKEAEVQFQRLAEFADYYGLNLLTLTQTYKSFAAASLGANMSLEETNYIFDSVAKAASVLKLSTEQLDGSLMAIQQMISKGTVSAEELRGQLGERLPNAFGLAAKALGLTTQELGKMLEQGQILASDLLPRLANELNNTYGNGITQKVDNLQASVNRLDNAFTNAVKRGNVGLFFKTIVDGANEALKLLESRTWDEFFGRITAGVTGNIMLAQAYDMQTNALKKLNKEQEKATEFTPDLSKFVAPAKKEKQDRSGTKGADLETMGTLDDVYSGLAAQKTKEFNDQVERLNKSIQDLKITYNGGFVTDEELERMTMIKGIFEGMATTISIGIGQAFADALVNGQDFGKAMLAMLKQLIARLLAAAAAAALLAALVNLGTFGASGAAAGASFGSTFLPLFSSLSGMGNVGGRSASVAGVPAPSQGSVSFEIRGDKLYGVLQNYNERLDRLT